MSRKKAVEKKPGAEYLDPTPLEVPLGLTLPRPLNEMVKDMVKHEMSEAADRSGYETLQEADDFDVPDYDDGEEPDFLSRHEILEAQEAPLDDFFEEEAARRESLRSANEREIEALTSRLQKLESLRDSPPGESGTADSD